MELHFPVYSFIMPNPSMLLTKKGKIIGRSKDCGGLSDASTGFKQFDQR